MSVGERATRRTEDVADLQILEPFGRDDEELSRVERGCCVHVMLLMDRPSFGPRLW